MIRMNQHNSKKAGFQLALVVFTFFVHFQSVLKPEAKMKDADYYEYFSGVKESSGIYKMKLKDSKLVIWGTLMKIDAKTGKIKENLAYKKRSIPIAKDIQIYALDEGQQDPISKSDFKKKCKKGFGGCNINIRILNGKVISIGIS